MRRASRPIALALGIVLALAGSAVLVGLLLDSSQNASCNPSDPSPIAKPAEPAGDGFPKVNWDKWLAVNGDVVGWVTVPGTKVNHPIVQASPSDPERYLHTSVYGSWSAYGAPFLDADCAEEGLTGSANAIVYGHHMNDGSVFSAFASFTDAGFREKHSPVLLQTPDGGKWRLTPVKVERVNAESAEASADDEVAGLDRCVTFVTCSYGTWANERTLVHCSLEQVAGPAA